MLNSMSSRTAADATEDADANQKDSTEYSTDDSCDSRSDSALGFGSTLEIYGASEFAVSYVDPRVGAIALQLLGLSSVGDTLRVVIVVAIVVVVAVITGGSALSKQAKHS